MQLFWTMGTGRLHILSALVYGTITTSKMILPPPRRLCHAHRCRSRGDKGIDPPSFEFSGDNPPHFSGKNVCKNYVTWSLITTNDGINCVIWSRRTQVRPSPGCMQEQSRVGYRVPARAYYKGDDGGKLPPISARRGNFLHLGGIQNLPVWQTRDFLGTVT